MSYLTKRPPGNQVATEKTNIDLQHRKSPVYSTKTPTPCFLRTYLTSLGLACSPLALYSILYPCHRAPQPNVLGIPELLHDAVLRRNLRKDLFLLEKLHFSGISGIRREGVK